MVTFLKKNFRELVFGIVLTSIIFIGGYFSNVYLVKRGTVMLPLYILIHLFSFFTCFVLLTSLITKFPLYKILGVVGILPLIVLAEQYINLPNNPITISLLMIFWIGIFYLLLPDFFKKYHVVILFMYGVILSYFLIFRSTLNYIEYHRPIVNGFFIISISCLVFLWIYEQLKIVVKLKEDKLTAELAQLRSQLNPHFFFNTLNNLYGLVIEKSDQAPAVILKLSDMMSYTIYNGKLELVPLEDELKYLDDYIDLHKLRYHKRVSIRFEKNISHSHKIAPLLLIVLLENAFKHGVESITENAFVRIEVNTTKSSINFHIENNYEPSNGKINGIGLENLQKRLALIYPDKHKLNIERSANNYLVNLEINS